MDPALFESIPHDTNAVEAYHRFSKGKAMEPLQVALMTVYKEDKLAALQYLASCKGISTTYNDKTPAGRKKRADKATEKVQVDTKGKICLVNASQGIDLLFYCFSYCN